MKTKSKLIIIYISFYFLFNFIFTNEVFSQSEETNREVSIVGEETNQELKGNVIQRVIKPLDQRSNSFGNLNYFVNNNGRIGYDIISKKGKFTWQSDTSKNRIDAKINYIFGNGIFIFGKTRKLTNSDGVEINPEDNSLKNFLVTSYNLNDSESDFVAGRLEDSDILEKNLSTKYQIFSSRDYDENGNHIFDNLEPNWPLWDFKSNSFGRYIYNENQRNSENGTPIFVSDEDLFFTYKIANPVKLQVETTIYNYDKNSKKSNNLQNNYLNNVIIVNNLITNNSNDTIFNCRAGHFSDIDITPVDKLFLGQYNDNLKILINKNNLNDKILFGYTDSSNIDINQNKYGFIFTKLLYNSPIQQTLNGNKVVQENNINIPIFDEKSIKKTNAGLLDVNTNIYSLNYFDNFINNDNNTIESSFSQDIRSFLSTDSFYLAPNEKIRYIYMIGFVESLEDNNIPTFDKDNIHNTTNLYNTLDEVNDFFAQNYSSTKDNAKEIIYDDNLKIYPNPAINYIEVDIENIELEKINDYFIEITNNNGEKFAGFSLSNNQDYKINNQRNIKIKIDLTNIQSGVYFIKVKALESNKSIYSSKFIITK